MNQGFQDKSCLFRLSLILEGDHWLTKHWIVHENGVFINKIRKSGLMTQQGFKPMTPNFFSRALMKPFLEAKISISAIFRRRPRTCDRSTRGKWSSWTTSSPSTPARARWPSTSSVTSLETSERFGPDLSNFTVATNNLRQRPWESLSQKERKTFSKLNKRWRLLNLLDTN